MSSQVSILLQYETRGVAVGEQKSLLRYLAAPLEGSRAALGLR